MTKLLLPPNNNIKIDGKSVYKLYLQIKNHFNGRRDVVKSNWKMNLSDASYNKRKDKIFFERLSKRFTLKQLCLIFIGNFILNEDLWIGNITDSDPTEFYDIYISKLKLVKSRFVDDINSIYYMSKKMNISLKEMFSYRQDNISYVFKLLQNNLISFESFIMLDSFLGIIDIYDEQDNIIWLKYSTRLKAYRSLFYVESEQQKQIFFDVINNIKY